MTGKGTGDFQNLDIIKDHAADREFKIADVMEGMEANLFVQTDEASKLVIFTVSKKLNWFKTSKRHIVLDLRNRLLRNETIHGLLSVCVRQ